MTGTRRHAAPVLLGLFFLSVLSFMLAMQVGGSPVSAWKFIAHCVGMGGDLSATDRQILMSLRLPRVLAAFSVGGLLGVSGLLMQVLLRNPLADPYILGVSGGAGLGGIATLLIVPAVAAAWALPVGAAIGALLVILIVFGLTHWLGVHSLDRLLLTGVAISALCSALVSLMLSFSNEGLFRGLVFWLLGELSGTHAYALLFAWVLMLCLVWPLARMLNVIVLGDDLAHSLGVSTRSARQILYWLGALFTGIAVSAGGMIGFVGLVVPHTLRLLMGNDHRLLIPSVAIGGGVFLMLADALARTVVAPVQLPVGVVTALIGAPIFVVLLIRGHRP